MENFICILLQIRTFMLLKINGRIHISGTTVNISVTNDNISRTNITFSATSIPDLWP